MQSFGDLLSTLQASLADGDAQGAFAVVKTFPSWYRDWWLALLDESPYHVVVETFLVLFIVYVVFFKRSYNPQHRGYGARGPVRLSKAEVDELIDEWEPTPLCAAPTAAQRELEASTPVVEAIDGGYLSLRGARQPVLDLATFNFLGFSGRADVREVAVAGLDKYGCGSCGPRGFYGTIDTHQRLEEDFAEVFGVSETISYSDSFSTVASTISAFAKRGDLLVVDKGVHAAAQVGAKLSRSQIRWFEHNDMDDLKRVLGEVVAEDRRKGRDAVDQRRFIVVEGLYRNFGDLCPLDEVVECKHNFKFRLIVDDSYAVGTLGATGRGSAEHWGVPQSDIDILTLALDTSLGGVGGVTVGDHQVVDHQRLSGAGYCFSASMPPFVSLCVSKALAELRADPGLVEHLQHNAEALRAALADAPGLQVVSQEGSPIIHLALAGDAGEDRDRDRQTAQGLLQDVADAACAAGVAVGVSRYVEARECFLPPPTLRVTARATLTSAEIANAGDVVCRAAAAVFGAGAVRSPPRQTSPEVHRRRSMRLRTPRRL